MGTTDTQQQQPNQRLKHEIRTSLLLVSQPARSLFSLLAIHCRGPKRARTASDLAAVLTIHPREVNDLVRELRQAGLPICASTAGDPGYFLPLNREQAQSTLASLERRFKMIAVIRGRFAQGLERWFGPPQLPEDNDGR